jgi:WD40 repeat protein
MDAATGQHRVAFTGHNGQPIAVAIAPDGTWLASCGGSHDRTARIWDAATGQHRATLTGHASRVTAVAIAPDSSWLATTSDDQTALIWDPATGGISAVMRVDGSLRDCAWSPSGHLLVAAGDVGIHLFAFNS